MGGLLRQRPRDQLAVRPRYTNRSRGLRNAKGEEASKPGPEGTPDSGAAEGSTPEADRAPAEVRKNWARLIRKVYEVDPLVCSRCGGEMKVIALIERPEVIKRILAHIAHGATEDDGRGPPSPEAPSESHVEPLFDDVPWAEPMFDDARSVDDSEEGDSDVGDTA